MSILGNPVASRYFTCQVCQRGVLVHRKTFRMSGPVVAIGFILLIPSILGIIFSALLFFGVVAAGGAGVGAGTHQAVANMRRHGIPEPIIAAVVAGQDRKAERMMDDWPLRIGGIVVDAGVPWYQRNRVHAAEAELRTSQTAAGIGTVLGGSFAVFLGVCSFVGGLLGWLLVMRKRVLQCSLCSAVISAS